MAIQTYKTRLYPLFTIVQSDKKRKKIFLKRKTGKGCLLDRDQGWIGIKLPGKINEFCHDPDNVYKFICEWCTINLRKLL